ncbi:MAG: Ig-like domain-containing protein, partial [Solirubrobacteraceae bacterium]
RLLTDGEGGGQSNSDDWFPWLAVDQTTGQAWADFYSTRDDATRRTTNFYLRSVTPAGGASHTLGTLTRVSSASSDYSTSTCCTFGNDYGDYTGLDATQGSPLPVWSDKRGGATADGEAYAFAYPTPTPPPDTVPPDTAITAGPAEGSSTADNTPTFAFTASEVGSMFECRIDEASFAPCTSPLTTAALGDGSHVFAVRATDGAGNTDQSPATRSFTVDTTAPESCISAGPADGGGTNDSTPTLAFSASEASATFECRLDEASFAPCTSPLTTPTLGDGSHRFGVRAIDGPGNVDASPASRSFTVDTVAPDTTIASGPAEGTTITATTASFGLASSEAGSAFECRIDLGAFAACGSPFTTGALAQGAHTFSARATDAAGNVDASPVSRAFTMLLPPSIGRGRVRTARASRKRVVVLRRPRVSCPGGPVACRVGVRATAVLRGARRSRIGSSARTLAAGRAGRVRFTLTRAGYRALVRRGRIRARVRISASRGSLRRGAVLTVTLLRPR